MLAAVLGRVILGEAVAPRTWGAIALALAGIFIMVREGLAAGALLGIVAALVSALGFAAFSVTLCWQRMEDSLPASLIGAAFAVVAGVVAASLFNQPLAIRSADLTLCVLMGVVTMSGGMILYTLGSRVVPSAELTLLSNTEVLLAPFWVWLVLGETGSAGTCVGGAILLTTILLNAYGGCAGPPLPDTYRRRESGRSLAACAPKRLSFALGGTRACHRAKPWRMRQGSIRETTGCTALVSSPDPSCGRRPGRCGR
ncbi:MAG: DMT family transporter [Paracoccaceae bacterium]